MINTGVSNFLEALFYIFVNSFPPSTPENRRIETPSLSSAEAQSNQTKFVNRGTVEYMPRGLFLFMNTSSHFLDPGKFYK